MVTRYINITLRHFDPVWQAYYTNQEAEKEKGKKKQLKHTSVLLPDIVCHILLDSSMQFQFLMDTNLVPE